MFLAKGTKKSFKYKRLSILLKKKKNTNKLLNRYQDVKAYLFAINTKSSLNTHFKVILQHNSGIWHLWSSLKKMEEHKYTLPKHSIMCMSIRLLQHWRKQQRMTGSPPGHISRKDADPHKAPLDSKLSIREFCAHMHFMHKGLYCINCCKTNASCCTTFCLQPWRTDRHINCQKLSVAIYKKKSTVNACL